MTAATKELILKHLDSVVELADGMRKSIRMGVGDCDLVETWEYIADDIEKVGDAMRPYIGLHYEART